MSSVCEKGKAESGRGSGLSLREKVDEQVRWERRRERDRGSELRRANEGGRDGEGRG